MHPAIDPQQALRQIEANMQKARPSQAPLPRLLAVSKGQSATAIRALARLGQRHFGENYVQEAVAKMRDLVDLPLIWHLIGPLQSNKCALAAQCFDWLASVDREKLVPLLSRHRPTNLPPLNVLVQVRVDEEPNKSGCAPEAAAALCAAIQAHDNLRLRGLMGIPQPHPEIGARRASFRRLHDLYRSLQARHPGMDTLSMGMSEDYEAAIAEGATEVRIGTALFGPRAPKAAV